MNTLINNAGQAVEVSTVAYNACKESFLQGFWSVIVRTLDGGRAVILLGENFQY